MEKYVSDQSSTLIKPPLLLVQIMELKFKIKNIRKNKMTFIDLKLKNHLIIKVFLNLNIFFGKIIITKP